MYKDIENRNPDASFDRHTYIHTCIHEICIYMIYIYTHTLANMHIMHNMGCIELPYDVMHDGNSTFVKTS